MPAVFPLSPILNQTYSSDGSSWIWNGSAWNMTTYGNNVPDTVVNTLLTESINTVGASGSASTIPAVTTATINRITLTANCVFTFPTATAGTSFTLELIQGSPGSRTVTWPSTVRWSGGTAPTLTTTTAKRDIFKFTCLDAATWIGFTRGLNYSA